MAWYRCGGGNGSSGEKKTAKLVLEAYAENNAQDNTFPRTQWDRNAKDSAYFSFSSNRWVAQKDFTALVILIHYQYRDASGSNSFSEATVNRDLISTYNFDAISLCPMAKDRFEGSYGVEYGFIKILAGDIVSEGKPTGLGWESPYFYILETEDDMPTTTLANGDNVSFTTTTVGYSILQNYFDFA